ncbi:MAG: hypothetical protein ABIP51_01590 [Bacteroidia bacterium]
MKKKQKLDEGVLNNVINWVSGLLNDTSHYMDSNGVSDITKGGDFKLILATTLGIAAIGTGLYFQDKIGAALKAAPGKIKSIVQAGKIIKNAQSREEAQSELASIGVKLPASETSIDRQPQMAYEARQIKKVLTLLEAQVDRDSAKRRK